MVEKVGCPIGGRRCCRQGTFLVCRPWCVLRANVTPPPDLRRLHDPDPEARCRAIQDIAVAGKSGYGREVVLALIDALGDGDPVVQEWATVALRRFKGDQAAQQALWECFESEQRESTRCCAIAGLGCLGEYLPADRLRTLYRDRRNRPDDLLLKFALHWTGKNADQPEELQALIDIEAAEGTQRPYGPQFQALVGAAVRRCTRRCLALGTITKPWIKGHGRHDLLEKLGETRSERLIEAERARHMQPALTPEWEKAGPDVPLVPGRALADVQEEQYVQDLAEFKNVRITEGRSYVRDQYLAREVKEAAGYICQVCFEHLDDPAMARRFVHAHHIEPLAELGADTRENLVALCPSCHAKLHAGQIKIESRPDGVYLFAGTAVPRPLGSTGPEDAQELQSAAACKRISELFARLERSRASALLQALEQMLKGPDAGR